MDKISIIIPIYNAEKYLEECIESVINQTYKNLEIILVDDGSTDESGKICDKYATIDERIKVIHEKNGCVSIARNAGMDIATGNYIMFIDADDYYEKNACEKLYNEIKEKNADYVIGNYIHIEPNGEKWREPLFDTEEYGNFKVSIKDYKKSFFVMNSVVWNKIYKREFLEKFHLRFFNGPIAEDAIFATFCYVNSDKGYFIKDIVYNYRLNKKNSSASTNCSKRYFDDMNKAYKKIYENFFNTNNIGFYRYFYARITPYMLCKIIDTDLLNDKELKEVLTDFEWFFKQKEEYDVVILNSLLDSIICNINAKNYEKVISEIKYLKNERMKLNSEELEKMYRPSEKLYERMSIYDEKYL